MPTKEIYSRYRKKIILYRRVHNGENRDKVQKINQTYYQKNKIEINERRRERYKNDAFMRLKASAKTQVNDAVRNGSLFKPLLCEDCQQEKRLEGHHHDYSKPLIVRWLCTTCHKIRHRQPLEEGQPKEER